MAFGMLPSFPSLVTWLYFFLFSQFVANFSIASPVLSRTKERPEGSGGNLAVSVGGEEKMQIKRICWEHW